MRAVIFYRCPTCGSVKTLTRETRQLSDDTRVFGDVPPVCPCPSDPARHEDMRVPAAIKRPAIPMVAFAAIPCTDKE